MILILDNYDSFTFNLAHCFRNVGEEVIVVRSDATNVDSILRRRPAGIVMSPGPGRPGDRGVGLELMREAAGRVPVLGVCLGHQALAVAFGARIERGRRAFHGKVSMVEHQGEHLFRGVSKPLQAMRYHSLVVDAKTLPSCLEVTAWISGEPETVMGLRHVSFPVFGIQFHPESFMTPEGPVIVRNFLDLCGSADS